MERGTLVKDIIFLAVAVLLLCFLTTLPIWSLAHEGSSPVDTSQMPVEGNSVNDFVPPGWAIEEQVSGDLNKDSLPDVALKLIEDKSVIDRETPDNRRRALIILFKEKDARFRRVAFAAKLLQSTCDGGAFHAFCSAPAHVTIQNGVLIVTQDFGSRKVVETTFRLRYEPSDMKFVLIGLDKADRDRLTGTSISKSTNFLTGMQITRHSRFSKRKGRNATESTVEKKVPQQTIFIEDVDRERY
jgi:hypothetical protein